MATIVLLAVVIAFRVRTSADLIRGSAVLMVRYTLLSPAYWPWYAVLPVAFLALVPRGAFLVLIVAMSLGSRLVAPLKHGRPAAATRHGVAGNCRRHSRVPCLRAAA
jgi:hypothetical protein